MHKWFVALGIIAFAIGAVLGTKIYIANTSFLSLSDQMDLRSTSANDIQREYLEYSYCVGCPEVETTYYDSTYDSSSSYDSYDYGSTSSYGWSSWGGGSFGGK